MAMGRTGLMAFLVASCVGVAAAPALAAQPAETMGPPASAAPPPAPLPPPLTRMPGPPRPADSDAAAYERCMKLARENPAAGRDLAERWLKDGGAHPADHCYAVALVGLKQYKEGAARLEKLAQAMDRAPSSLRAEVLDQAAQAWLLADDPARAYAAETEALNLRPESVDLLVDRAEAAGAAGWFDKAVADLDRALQADPKRVDALIDRASAYRALDRLDLALADIDEALKLTPNSAAALLERGDILRLKGDLDGARRDWVRVSQLAPGSAADTAAKTNIKRLDVKEPPAPPAGRH
jgi:tetratricopeptide (TPR) repeat protein